MEIFKKIRVFHVLIAIAVIANIGFFVARYQRSATPPKDHGKERFIEQFNTLRGMCKLDKHVVEDNRDDGAVLLECRRYSELPGEEQTSRGVVIQDLGAAKLVMSLQVVNAIESIDGDTKTAKCRATTKSLESIALSKEGEYFVGPIVLNSDSVFVVDHAGVVESISRKEMVNGQPHLARTYMVDPSQLPTSPVRGGDKWKLTAKVPDDAPESVKESPPSCEAELIRRVRFDGTDAFELRSVCKCYLDLSRSLESGLKGADAIIPYEEVRTQFVAVATGDLLWYESKSEMKLASVGGVAIVTRLELQTSK